MSITSSWSLRKVCFVEMGPTKEGMRPQTRRLSSCACLNCSSESMAWTSSSTLERELVVMQIEAHDCNLLSVWATKLSWEDHNLVCLAFSSKMSYSLTLVCEMLECIKWQRSTFLVISLEIVSLRSETEIFTTMLSCSSSKSRSKRSWSVASRSFRRWQVSRGVELIVGSD